MTVGVLPTKGTRLFFVAADSDRSIQKVACPTGIQGLGGPADQLDTTCLDSEEREFAPGLPNPGQLTIPINFIPTSESHQAILDLQSEGAQGIVSWMIVLSDQAGAPTTKTSDERLISPGATTAEFLGYVADFNIDIATNEIVRGTLTLQRSGKVNWTLPAATQP